MAVAVVVVLMSATGALAQAHPSAVRADRMLPAGFDHGPSMSAGQLHDRASVLRWLAPRVSASGRLVAAADGASSASPDLVGPRGAAGTMPDVTGDGLDEVFQLTFSPRRYTVRDGRTGRVLWQRAAQDLYDAEYALLGTPARRALMVQTFTTTAGVDQAGVTALDARTGATMWTTSGSPTIGADLAVAFVQADGVFLAGVGARPHRADQVLVGSVSFAASIAGAAATVVPRLVDGADGTAGAPGAPLVFDDFPDLRLLPDVTGDGTADYVLTSNGTTRQEVLEDGASGRPVWQHVSPDGTSFGSYVDLLPAAAGGKLGLLVSDGGFDGGAITAYAAATGSTLWTARGAGGEVVQDSDHDGVPDVVLVSFSSTGFDFQGLSGRTGRSRWRTSVSAPQGDGSSSLGGGAGGDLTGDGVDDLLFTLDVAGRTLVHEQFVVDGRSGRTTTYRHLEGSPLGARLSRRGDALVDLLARPGGLVISARDLSRTLWSSSFPLEGVGRLAFLDHGTLTRADPTDVLVSAFGPSGTFVLALDGRTGRQIWRVRV